jgi:FixJ family two-component response regulator
MSGRRDAIAVVEDDNGMREALERVLRIAGFEPRAYSSAEEFLGAAPCTNLRCLVLDIHLPGISGLDLQRRLMTMGPALPVVFITAHDTAAARKDACELDAVAFLVKPFEGRQLVNAVDSAIAKRSNGTAGGQ